MSNAKHLPGPWKIVNRPLASIDRLFVTTDSLDNLGLEVAAVNPFVKGAAENAALIAAAPELLAVLKLIVAEVYSGMPVRMDDAQMTAALEAIDRAEGGGQ